MANYNRAENRGIAPETTSKTDETRRPQVCGRLGCRETDELVIVITAEHGERVLCRRHAAAFGAQEVL